MNNFHIIKKITNNSKSYLIIALLKENITWIALIIFFIVFSIIFPNFASLRNLLNMLRQSAVLGIMAVGMTFAMISGSYDLSVGATMGLATVIVIQLQPIDLYSTIIAILVGLSVGLLIGLVNGFLVGKAGSNSVVATIGMMYVVLGITLIYTRGHHVWARNMYDKFAFLGSGNIGQFPVPTLIFLSVAIISQVILSLTNFGRELYATGSSQECSIFSGINIGWIKLKGYVISGLLASLGGVIMAARVNNVDPMFAVGYEFDVLTAVLLGGVSLLGGKGSSFGAVGGVFLMVMINNAMVLSGMTYEWESMVKGMLLIGIVIMYSLIKERRG